MRRISQTRLTFRLSADDREFLERAAAARGESVAATMRRAVHELQ